MLWIRCGLLDKTVKTAKWRHAEFVNRSFACQDAYADLEFLNDVGCVAETGQRNAVIWQICTSLQQRTFP